MSPGLYQLTAFAVKTGTYTLLVSLGKTQIANGNLSVEVSPGLASASASYITGLGAAAAQRYTRGQKAQFQVHLRDAQGNPAGAPAPVSVTATVVYWNATAGGTARVPQALTASPGEALGVTSYALVPSAVGTLRISALLPYADGTASFPIFNAATSRPYEVRVDAGAPSANDSTISGSVYSSGGVQGTPAVFSVCLRDAQGYPLSHSQSKQNRPEVSFKVLPTLGGAGDGALPGAPRVTVSQGEGCFHKVSFVPKKADNNKEYRLQITVTLARSTVGTPATVPMKAAPGVPRSLLALDENQVHIGVSTKQLGPGVAVLLGQPSGVPTVFSFQARGAGGTPVPVSDPGRVSVAISPFSGDSTPNATLVAGPVVATGVPGPTVSGKLGALELDVDDYGRVQASFTPGMPGVYRVQYSLAPSSTEAYKSFTLQIPAGTPLVHRPHVYHRLHAKHLCAQHLHAKRLREQHLYAKQL